MERRKIYRIKSEGIPQLSKHIGNGTGSFLPAVVYNQSGSLGFAEDWNKDYVPDLVLGNANGFQLI